jgi:Tfp pilus assembly protein PilN
MKAVNLLPSDLQPTGAPVADEPGGIAAFVVLGALAACLIALVAYVLFANQVDDRTAQLESLRAESRATTERVAHLKPYSEFQAMAEKRIQTVRDLAASRFDWEQSLRDIAHVVPANVTLTKLNGTISSQASGGGTSLRSAIAAPAIELAGCTDDQGDVATLLSRLRAVDGVTRVSLGKSLKADPAPEAATGAPVPGESGCSGSRAPAFEVVVFFERSEVPATVQDVTVQASEKPPAGEAASPDGEAATTEGDATR